MHLTRYYQKKNAMQCACPVEDPAMASHSQQFIVPNLGQTTHASMLLWLTVEFGPKVQPIGHMASNLHHICNMCSVVWTATKEFRLCLIYKAWLGPVYRVYLGLGFRCCLISQ